MSERKQEETKGSTECSEEKCSCDEELTNKSNTFTAEEILEEAMSYCFSEGFSEIFESFMKKNAKHFYDSVDKEYSDEHILKHKNIFDEYLQLYEETMDEWLEIKGLDIRQLSHAVTKAVKEGHSGDQFFVKLLVASTEYQCFYDVMIKEARYQLWQKDEKAETKRK